MILWLAGIWLCVEVCPDSLSGKIQNRAKCGPVSRSVILVDDYVNLWIICFWHKSNKKPVWFRGLRIHLLELSFLHISYLLLIWKPFGCRTTKLLSQKRHHLAIFCISFLWQKGTCPEKRRDYYLKKSHLEVFCINRTTIGCYDFIQITSCWIWMLSALH